MFEKELEAMIEASKIAREKILEIYHQDFKVEIKNDDSPVTLADKNADKIIREYLGNLFPSYGFLTEESDDDLSRLDKDYVFVVDPVDGTKDFIAKDDQFTTNIGLVYKHEVVCGVVSIPATNEIYFAIKNQGAYYQKDEEKAIKIHANDKLDNLTILTSHFHTTKEELEIIEKNKGRIAKVEKVGSSLKACRIAHGLAELSYRLSPNTKEWDTAASQIIVTEAGGIFAEPDLTPIKYNRKDVYNKKG
ncbi:MAG: 3'(2'),5'-bisphosphate nucleotidase CysQ, partial [Bacillales bacterium]|nr:3'(2'),5'-bisphosphate nucleotidase CysQ [Bacillales bacterium]